ncbi:MAG: hypothetical protein CVU46_03165 [Chloroflexi bacterium HGW-Chloroflexi-8]|nr:MAG: hypothetical protein CVU46_03165 [Chloroflexi bacterium HGW-Chloroflexi-8]
MKSITLSQAIAGYLINLSARHLSPNTVSDYTNTLTKLTKNLGNDIPISDIGIDQVNAFLAGFTTLSNKTLSNYHSTLSSFFEWMIINKLVKNNPVKFVLRAKPERRVIDPVPEMEIKALLDAASHSRDYARSGKKTCRNKLPTADRNTAIIFFILDNGLRVTELCNLQIKDLDLKQLRAFIMGKGSKERYVPFSPRTSQAIWRYHSKRGELYLDDFVFSTELNRQMERGYILKMLSSASERAGISHVHPHRLRHTFAINYLRAGGDIFTLQMILGHESLDMVRHYSRIAQSDVKRAHRRASPVEYLRL